MKPATLLSLIFHGTVPRYRDEIHFDIDQAFERFAINAAGFARFGSNPLPSVHSVQLICKDVEIAASRLRNRESGAKLVLAQHSARLFEVLGELLAAEVASDIAAPAQPDLVPPNASFLTKLYCLFYSPAFRRYATAGVVLANVSSATPDVKVSWDFIKDASSGKPVAFATAREHTHVLCAALFLEFNATLWLDIW
jgi:hypothetical protein